MRKSQFMSIQESYHFPISHEGAISSLPGITAPHIGGKGCWIAGTYLWLQGLTKNLLQNTHGDLLMLMFATWFSIMWTFEEESYIMYRSSLFLLCVRPYIVNLWWPKIMREVVFFEDFQVVSKKRLRNSNPQAQSDREKSFSLQTMDVALSVGSQKLSCDRFFFFSSWTYH